MSGDDGREKPTASVDSVVRLLGSVLETDETTARECPATRVKHVKESLVLLAQGEKLGMTQGVLNSSGAIAAGFQKTGTRGGLRRISPLLAQSGVFRPSRR